MTTASDNFSRPNETPLATPWVSGVGGGMNLTSNAATSVAGTDKVSFYNGTWGNDQECTFTVGGLASSLSYAGGVLRFNATSGGNGYAFITDGGTGAAHSEIATWTNGVYNAIASVASTFANGDVVRFTVVGTTLTVYKNTVSVGSTTSSAFSAGNPGVEAYGVGTVNTWSATDNAAPVSTAMAWIRA